jgi:signal transduction histidine kinase/HAMP domain-containing protein
MTAGVPTPSQRASKRTGLQITPPPSPLLSPTRRGNWFQRLPLGRRLSLLAVLISAVTLSAVVYIALISTSFTLRRETTNALARQNMGIGNTLDRELTIISLLMQDRIAPSVSRLYQPDLPITELREAVLDITRLEPNLLFDRIVLYVPDQNLQVFNFFNVASGDDMMSRTVNADAINPDDWFVRAYEAESYGWSGPERYAPISGATDVITVAVPFINLQGERIGLMWAEVSISTVNMLLRESIAMEGGLSADQLSYAFLLGKDGRSLASYNTRLHEDELTSLASILPGEGVSDLDSSPIDTARSFAIVSPMSDTTWRLVTVLPDSVLPELPYATVVQILVISLAGLLVMVWSINWLIRNTVSRPAWTLNMIADQIGSGILNTSIPAEMQDMSDEIGSIARAMEDMRSRLETLYETLDQRVRERTAQLEIARSDAQSIAEELQAIYDESLVVVSDYHLQSILHNFVRRILSLLMTDFCTVWLMRSNGEQLRLVATSEGSLPPNDVFIQLGEGMAGTVAMTGKPLRLAHYSRYSKRLKSEEDAMERALSVPMLASGRTIGVVVIGRSADDMAFTENDQRMLTLFSNLVSPAVSNAQLYVELEEAHERTDRANQVKTRFLASVTHELRTPLNFIINNMDFMRIGAFGDLSEEQMSRLDQTIRSAEHLLYLINDLLDVSKIEAGEMQMFIQNTDMYTLIEDALDAAQMLLDKSEDKRGYVHLSSSIPLGLPPIPMDARRIRQVLHNLLSNAIKFTEVGEVELRAETFDDQKGRHWLRFSVRDTGIGIPEGAREQMFEPFNRTQDPKHAAIEGTGLGLSISRFLVHEHGGELNYESTLGVGTTFWFILPMFPLKRDTRPVITQIMRALTPSQVQGELR